MQSILPDLVSQGPDGYYTMNYAGLVTYIVKAVQQLASQLSDLANTVASFADHFTTRELRATGDEIDANTGKFHSLCVGNVCVTEAQFMQVFGSDAASQTAGAGASQNQASSTPASAPIISINGNNPAHIHVGATYNDLGATITGPADADKNLGIHLYLDGAAVPSISLDTSASSTHAIDYVAENSAGTATSTRTIFVEGVQPPPAQEQAEQVSEQATSTAQISGENASSTPPTL